MGPDEGVGEGARPAGEPRLSDFLGEPTRDLAAWRWLWSGDRRFPISSHRGLVGRVIVAFKRLFGPFARTAQADLWERQRVFNLILLEQLQRDADRFVPLEQRAGWHDEHLARLEAFWREGLYEVMRHDDALFARVDQKVDRLRRESRDLWARLGAALALAEQGQGEPLQRRREELSYLELEARHRGTEGEIRERLSVYLPWLGAGEVLDLGCGRGEWLELLRAHGRGGRGVDSSAEMVAECRAKGLAVEEENLLEALARQPEASLGSVVSFHVVEHLPPAAIDRLVRLAWRALAPGGTLILETPSPLSLVVAAQSFWLDPTHLRPVHPDWLTLTCELAGFVGVERLDLRPFPAEQRLPEIDLAGLAPELRQLADQVNRLRDRLDGLLFGPRDYAIIARRPGAARG